MMHPSQIGFRPRRNTSAFMAHQCVSYPAMTGWPPSARPSMLSPTAAPFRPLPPPPGDMEKRITRSEEAVQGLVKQLEERAKDATRAPLPSAWHEVYAEAQSLLASPTLPSRSRHRLTHLCDRVDNLMAATFGLRQRFVFETPPAHLPGIQPKDVLLKVDGRASDTTRPDWHLLATCKTVTVRRADMELCLDPRAVPEAVDACEKLRATVPLSSHVDSSDTLAADALPLSSPVDSSDTLATHDDDDWVFAAAEAAAS